MRNRETKPKEINVGAMKKRCETMADGKRYIVYYTFEKAEESTGKSVENEEKENV